MAILECKNCGKEFETPDWQARRGRKYCGVPCANEAKKDKTPPGFEPGKTTLVCQQCNQPFEVWKAWVKRGRRKFCSWECKTEHQKTLTGEDSPRFGKKHTEKAKRKMATPKPTGKDSPHWKGGKHQRNGYVMIHRDRLKPNTLELVEPMLTKKGYILEHRMVMAKSLGRPLTSGEAVHHVNGKKNDNRLENLQLFPNAAHSRKHREVERELSKARAENEKLKEEITRLKSLLATCREDG